MSARTSAAIVSADHDPAPSRADGRRLKVVQAKHRNEIPVHPPRSCACWSLLSQEWVQAPCAEELRPNSRDHLHSMLWRFSDARVDRRGIG